MNIAFVTREISGLGRAGGIGTAVRHACEHFARHGEHEIHVYYTGRPIFGILRYRKEIKTLKILIHCKPLLRNMTRNHTKRVWNTFIMLSSTRHDVYLFHEYAADGFFCFQKKKQGCAFAASALGVITHGSSLWVDEGNGHTDVDAYRQQLYAMEQSCCEHADFLVSPSDYLLDWMRAQGWNLPETSRRIANFRTPPDGVPSVRPAGRLTPSDIREIVFFGRLEERKGVRIFCDALNMLPGRLLTGRAIVFLGKEDHFREREIRALLRPVLQREGVSLHFLTDYDSMRARAYLRREGVFAVMPSLRENSPCAVGECLEYAVPFIASSVGGGKELIREEDREHTLFFPQKEALAKRLTDILDGEGIATARPSLTQDDIYGEWQSLLRDIQYPAVERRGVHTDKNIRKMERR
jgi:glycosyltransferase involved in cell wall biosynthesis